jgi:hypothetical protein
MVSVVIEGPSELERGEGTETPADPARRGIRPDRDRIASAKPTKNEFVFN